MSTAPNGYQIPKTNWQVENVPLPSDFNRVEGNIQAIEEGSRTLDPAQAPSGNTGTLRQILDWLANRIKAITGGTNWYDAPAATLASLLSLINDHTGRTDNPHSVTAAQVDAAAADHTHDDRYYTESEADGRYAAKSNPTITGALSINDANTKLLEGSSNAVKIQTNSGYVEIGPQNTTYAHIYTDRGSFYLNKDVLINGNKVWHAGNDGAGSGLDADLLDGKHALDFLSFVAGDYVLNNNTTLQSTSSTSYTLVKKTQMIQGGTLRISFSLYISSASYTAYGRVYRNGTPVGTERTTTSTTAVVFTEDIAGWAAGDYVEVYAYCSGGTAYVKDLAVKVGNGPFAAAVL